MTQNFYLIENLKKYHQIIEILQKSSKKSKKRFIIYYRKYSNLSKF